MTHIKNFPGELQIELTSSERRNLLEESSQEITAFTVPGTGQRYQWTVTPMGLQGSTASAYIYINIWS